LDYRLEEGYVHNWLAAGPHLVPVTDLADYQGPDYKLQIAKSYYQRLSEIHKAPMEGETFQVGREEQKWSYYRCLDDHLVDRSTFCHTTHHLRAWAYTQVEAADACQASMVLTTNGPADVWINGRHAHRQEHFHHQDPHSVPFEASLNEGWNEVLVRFEEVAARECPYGMALQIVEGIDRAGAVRVPTYIDRPEDRLKFEHTFEHAHIERDRMFQGEGTTLHWPDGVESRLLYTFRLQDWRNRIYLEGAQTTGAGESVSISVPGGLEQGQYKVVLMPRPELYYQYKLRYTRELPIYVSDTPYSTAHYDDYEGRRREALEYAARQEKGIYAEIAKFALGRGATAKIEPLMEAIEGINQRGDCSDFYLVGLLGLLYRFRYTIAFPKQLLEPLKQCILDFKYWHDEPGADAMCYTTENHSILFHACEILAGQLYPDEVFSNTGETGQWHREKGERLALEWLRQRGTTGFTEWDSNCYFEEDILALSHLSDLAETVEVRELAAVAMDKLFFTMALNSFKGTFGSTHGRTYSRLIKGGYMEATSGLSRLAWGMGVWNESIRGIVGLASSGYELPGPIGAVALDLTNELWNKEQHGPDPAHSVNKVTYRTADYMLCSAQDYHPGEKGYQQHIWQATLSPGAVVFVTHPPCSSEEGAHRPNFWHGNYVLPRVAQFKGTLAAIHSLPDDDWMGFTHAYWPVYDFDEQTLRESKTGQRWAFARVGSGYLALTAAQGLALVEQGPSAYRELRSYGQHNTWLCMMGREETDGGFDAFQQAVLGLDVDLRGLGVSCTTLRGESFSFGWEGPLVVDGEEQSLSGYKHYDNPYCQAEPGDTQMDVQFGEYIVRLHFEPEG
jgi:hypothetical protein